MGWTYHHHHPLLCGNRGFIYLLQSDWCPTLMSKDLSMDRFARAYFSIIQNSCILSTKAAWVVYSVVVLGFIALKCLSFIVFDIFLCHFYHSCDGSDAMIAYLEGNVFPSPVVLLLKSPLSLWSLSTMYLRSLVVSFVLLLVLMTLSESQVGPNEAQLLTECFIYRWCRRR